ncbi:hypothetical protein [Serratia sp. 1D1416]|uniref:hypothetical protein n=1 Tax=Serratia sp. 1D1416 TaxID=2447890 RepID=UPI001013C7D3
MTQTLTTERLKTIAAWRAKYGAGHNVMIPAEEAEAMARELLANREAQPVAYLNKFSGVCMTLEQQPNAADDVAVYAPLYTAPPAPANANPVALVDRCIAACPGASLSVGLAPAVQAQPVSQGYRLPDNVREALTLALQAMEFMGDTLNNIDAVCTEDVEYVTPAFTAVRGLLAAAPEGDNG